MRRAACVSLLLGLAGCGGHAGRSTRSEPGTVSGGAPVVVVVENTSTSAGALSIQLVSATGERTILGAVGPQRTETFPLEGVAYGVSYRLVAGLAGGGNIASERFALSPGARIRWRLPFNTLRVRD